MTRFVVDASVAVEYLLRTPLGLSVADTLETASTLIAPELMDAEVVSVLRRALLSRRLEEERALMALEDLYHWPVERLSHQPLAILAWQYHRNVSAYDAFYIAAARAHDIPILTAGSRLARASGLGVVVQHVSM